MSAMVHPSDSKVKQAFIQEIMDTVRHVDNAVSYNPDLAKDIHTNRDFSPEEPYHVLTTSNLRNIDKPLLGSSTVGTTLTRCVVANGCHCGEASRYGAVLLSIVDEDVYQAITGGQPTYRISNSKEKGGVDHCYIACITDPKKFNELTFGVLDPWYGEIFEKPSQDLHYIDSSEAGKPMTEQSDFIKVRKNGREDPAAIAKDVPWPLRNEVIYTLCTDSEELSEALANTSEILRKKRDDKCNFVLEKIIVDLGNTKPVTIADIACIRSWHNNFVERYEALHKTLEELQGSRGDPVQISQIQEKLNQLKIWNEKIDQIESYLEHKGIEIVKMLESIEGPEQLKQLQKDSETGFYMPEKALEMARKMSVQLNIQNAATENEVVKALKTSIWSLLYRMGGQIDNMNTSNN